MKGKVFYEWVVEEVDQHGDIQDVSHWDTFEEAVSVRDQWLSTHLWQWGHEHVEIASIRGVGDEDNGLHYRGYAYVNLDNMTIESHYCCGSKVPQHIIKQVA